MLKKTTKANPMTRNFPIYDNRDHRSKSLSNKTRGSPIHFLCDGRRNALFKSAILAVVDFRPKSGERWLTWLRVNASFSCFSTSECASVVRCERSVSCMAMVLKGLKVVAFGLILWARNSSDPSVCVVRCQFQN